MQIEVPMLQRVQLRTRAQWLMYEGGVEWGLRLRTINHGLNEGMSCKRRHSTLVQRWHVLYWSA